MNAIKFDEGNMNINVKHTSPSREGGDTPTLSALQKLTFVFLQSSLQGAYRVKYSI